MSDRKSGFKSNPTDNGFRDELPFSLLKFSSRLKENYVALFLPVLISTIGFAVYTMIIMTLFIFKNNGHTAVGGILLIISGLLITFTFHASDPATKVTSGTIVVWGLILDRRVKDQVKKIKRQWKKERGKITKADIDEIKDLGTVAEVKGFTVHPNNKKAVIFPDGGVGMLVNIVGAISPYSFEGNKKMAADADANFWNATPPNQYIYRITTTEHLKFKPQLKLIESQILYAKKNNLQARRKYLETKKSRLLELIRVGESETIQYELIRAKNLGDVVDTTQRRISAIQSAIASRFSVLDNDDAVEILNKLISDKGGSLDETI